MASDDCEWWLAVGRTQPWEFCELPLDRFALYYCDRGFTLCIGGCIQVLAGNGGEAMMAEAQGAGVW